MPVPLHFLGVGIRRADSGYLWLPHPVLPHLAVGSVRGLFVLPGAGLVQRYVFGVAGHRGKCRDVKVS